MELTKKQIQTRKKYSSNISISKKLLIFIIFILFFSIFIMYSERYAKSKNSTSDITSMIKPIQYNLPFNTVFYENINGIDVKFTRIAEYQISGRVVEEYDYTSGIAGIVGAISNSSSYNNIAIKDVAISYGPMALSENHKKMTYVMSGSRRISYAVKDTTLLDEIGDINELRSYITNNHLIAANKEIEDLINKINKDDFVQITGYLVNASWKYGIYDYELTTSTTRDDIGNGACEIIYVEDIKWIK